MDDEPWPMNLVASLVRQLPPPLPTILYPFLRSLTPLVSMLHTPPSEWNTTTIAMSLFTAYMALRSLRQTWSWLTFFVRWGFPILFVTLGVLIGFFPDGSLKAAGWAFNQAVSRYMGSGASPSAGRQPAESPRIWDSFREHQAYRNEHASGGAAANGGPNDPGAISSILSSILTSAQNGNWLDAAKYAFDGIQGQLAATGEAAADHDAESASASGRRRTSSRRNPPRKAKSRARTSNSR